MTQLKCALLASPLLLAACGGGTRAPAVRVGAVTHADAPAALASDGTSGELKSGRILDRRGRLLARLRVATRGQRGLLGLVRDRAGRLVASWVAPRGRMLVGRVSPRRILWRGPQTSMLANGGHLALSPDGSIVVSVGDRQGARHSGRILALDPLGRAAPRRLSTGWNNPFAFGFDGRGRLWVADNAPGAEPERLARGDLGRPRDVVDLPRHVAPAGLAAAFGGLVVCGYVSHRLELHRLDGGRPQAEAVALPGACSLGVVARPGGGVLAATDHEFHAVLPR